MKKILALLMLALCFGSCMNNTTTKETPTEEVTVIDTLDSELLEFMQSFNTVKDISGIKTEKINIKAFQVNSDACLAREYKAAGGGYGFYTGPVVFFVLKLDNLPYDEMIDKGTAYFVGTYTYKTQAGGTKTVKAYFEDYDVACEFIELANKIKEQ